MAVHQPVGGAALAIFALHHQLVLRPNTSLNFPMRLTLRFRAIEEIARRLVLHKNRSASSSSLCLIFISLPCANRALHAPHRSPLFSTGLLLRKCPKDRRPGMHFESPGTAITSPSRRPSSSFAARTICFLKLQRRPLIAHTRNLNQKETIFFFVLRLPEPQASQNLYLAVAGTAETNGRLSFVPIRLKRKRESPPCRIAPRKIICQMQTDSAHRVNRHFVTYGWETLTLAGNAYRELPPVREPDAYTDVSRELSCELCSLALPDSTMYFMDTPPQGSPDNCLLGPGSNSAGSGGLYAPPASCWFVASLSFASRSSFAFWPAPYY